MNQYESKHSHSLVHVVNQRSLLGAVIHILLFLNASLLVLLVLANQIIHVRLSLSKFHLIHTLRSVPVQESLSSKHGTELVTNSLEQLLDRSGVTDESSSHVQILWRNRANSSLHVVRNPLDEVVGVPRLNLVHFIVDFLHGNITSEESSNSQVTTVSWVRSSHHVLSIEHLLGQFRNGQRSEGLGAHRSQRSVTNHKEVQSWERNQVDGQLSQVGVQLAGVTQGGGDTRHDGGNQVVQLVVRRLRQTQSFLANVVQGLVIDTEGLV